MLESEVQKNIVLTTLGTPESGITTCRDEFPADKSIYDIVNYTLACKGLDVKRIDITKRSIKEIIIVRGGCE